MGENSYRGAFKAKTTYSPRNQGQCSCIFKSMRESNCQYKNLYSMLEVKKWVGVGEIPFLLKDTSVPWNLMTLTLYGKRLYI